MANAAKTASSIKAVLRSCKVFSDKAFINGKWSSAASGKTFSIEYPATEEEVADVPDFGRQDVADAIGAASDAFKTWQHEPAALRSSLLRQLRDGVLANKDDLATIMTVETGKVLADSHWEIQYAAAFLEWFAEEAKRIDGDILASPNRDTRRFVLKKPVGVSALITPWNSPLSMLTRMLGAAVAAGCSVVIKPSEETPLTALSLAKIAQDIGFPPGVINAVTCSRQNVMTVGEELSTNPLVRKIAFTGSTAAGKWLLEKASGTAKKMSMELGGSAPFIVFNSADVDVAVACLLLAKFRNNGQACICPDRLFVQAGIHDEFVAALKNAMEGLKIGDPFDSNHSISCLINGGAVAKMERQQADAVSLGAEILVGGSIDKAGNLFYPPTLLTNCSLDMSVMKEETFGPLVPVMKFTTEDEVMSAANDTPAGLAGYFFSNDQSQMWRVAEELEVGMVGINESAISAVDIPFGGVKESGLGREGSKYGIEEYLELKYLCWGQLQR